MRKVIFALSLISLGLMTVSCTTDSFDLPETEELQLKEFNEQEFEDFDYSAVAKDGEEDETTNTDDTTDPVITDTKKD